MQVNLSRGINLKFLFKRIISPRYLLYFFGIFLPAPELFSQDYFQQEVNYTIRVSLDDRKHELNGFESIQYINNSPDTLTFLYFHLWPNAYSDNNTELAKELIRRDGKSKLFNDDEQRGYIDSLNFEADNKRINREFTDGPDICKLLLNKPLNPGDTILIQTPFHVRIPAGGISRLGHMGQAYQVSQWYPKPAVYDNHGWHQMHYLDQGEFYSEYGSFDVSITLPSNYLVAATGNLQTATEKSWLDKLSADTAWLRIPDYIHRDFPPSSSTLKTIRFTGNNIHDFAWFADKRFKVMKGSVKLPGSGRVVTTWSMFTASEAYFWKKTISYINSAIWYFSKWNGDYPYDSFTAVQSTLSAGDGMEYPGVTVISETYDPYLLDEVIAHEICHSWFYSSLGSDERRYPFMDESITTSNETRYMTIRYPEKKLWELKLSSRKLAKFFRAEKIPVDRIQEIDWVSPARLNMEQSINLPSPCYSFDNYGSILYSKAPIGFTYLRSWLGDSLYDSIMHDYNKLWKNKHPQPQDLRNVFESHTDKDLSWLFDDFLGTTKRLDYKIVKYDEGRVLVKNKGELNAPLVIAEYSKDTARTEKWIDGFRGQRWINTSTDNISSLKIDPDHKMTELFRLNNNIKTSGIFPRADPVELQFLYSLEDPAKRYLIWVPLINWNHSDGLMLGVGLQNSSAIPKTLQYFLMPFFSIQKAGLTGYGKISLNSIPYNSFIRMTSFSLEGVQFGAPGTQNFKRTKLGLDVFFKPTTPTRGIDQKIFGYYILASDLRKIEALIPADMLSFVQAGYNIEKHGPVNPFKLDVLFEAGDSYSKTSLTLDYKLSYYGKKSGFETKFYVATMIKNTATDPFYNIAASGRTGTEEYLFQDVFPDRFSKFPATFFSRQMTLQEGGIVSHINDTIGYSRWLSSVTFSSGFPGRASIIPIKPFITFLLNDHGPENHSPALYFEAGIKAGIWNVFEIFFPFIVSNNIDIAAPTMNERIRFTFRLNNIRTRF